MLSHAVAQGVSCMLCVLMCAMCVDVYYFKLYLCVSMLECLCGCCCFIVSVSVSASASVNVSVSCQCDIFFLYYYYYYYSETFPTTDVELMLRPVAHTLLDLTEQQVIETVLNVKTDFEGT